MHGRSADVLYIEQHCWRRLRLASFAILVTESVTDNAKLDISNNFRIGICEGEGGGEGITILAGLDTSSTKTSSNQWHGRKHSMLEVRGWQAVKLQEK